jgi:UDP-glucuronate 4-epimerase
MNHRVYNVGSSEPVELMRFIRVLEAEVGRTAELEMLPMQPGDVSATFADVRQLERDFGFRPATAIEEGIRRFVAWYREYRDATIPAPVAPLHGDTHGRERAPEGL